MATSQRDYYDILGVPRGASDADVKKAFRKLAQQWHPDVNTDAGADHRFKEINEAYQVLSDPKRRQAYDLFGTAGLGDAGAESGPFTGFSSGTFGDLFDAFFGGQASAAGRRPRPPSGSDLRYDLTISFDDAVKGAEKELVFDTLDRCAACGGSGAKPGTSPTTCPQCGGRGEVRITRPTMIGQMINVTRCPQCRGEGKVIAEVCPDCQGEGRVPQAKHIQVTIPAGIDDGHQIRLSGEGEAGPRGGLVGDLYVAVHVTPKPGLRREGTELFHDLRISMTDAALGTRATVPTADGQEEIEIKPGTQPDAEIRLRGKGMPYLRRAGTRGDLHVHVDVRIPTKLSRHQRELLEEYRAEEDEGADGRHDGKAGGNGDEPLARRVRSKVKDALG
jgi:molecular chaperone DnaJ